MTLQVVLGTVRNASTDWRAETSDIVSAIGQRSHAVLSDLLTSLDHLALVRAGDRGQYDRHIDIALNFAGNAVQKFDDLEPAICAADEQAKSSFKGLDPLAKQLGETIELFPDKNTHWQAERAKTSNYRNYLTHQGRIFRIHHNGDILIPSPESLKNRRVYTWTHADRAYAADPTRWVEVTAGCQTGIDDTIAYLDLAYERVCIHLDRFLGNPKYQFLWGWRDDIDPVLPTPMAPTHRVTPLTSGYGNPTSRNENPHQHTGFVSGSGVRHVP